MIPATTRRSFLKAAIAVPIAFSFNGIAFAAKPDESLHAGAPPLPGDGSFTIAVLPDTQNYCVKNPEGFLAQTRWLVENRETRRIAAVLHLGDITNNNVPKQWEIARQAMSQLNGQLPYFYVPGNHDYGDNGKANNRSSLLDEYFPRSKYEKLPTFGGTYDKEPGSMVNSYHLFTAGGRDFLVICLEFGPRKDVVRWANEIAAKYANREAILITHAYVNYDDTRYDWQKFGNKQSWSPHCDSYPLARNSGDDVMDGEELWQNLVSKHENFILTLNGHVLQDGLGRLTTATPGRRDVHQMLVNYQMKPNGGDGWLRLMEFTPARKVEVHDYSPTLDQTNLSAQTRFTLQLSAVGRATR